MKDYRIQHTLQTGSQTASYLAVTPDNGREVVLKFITQPQAQKSDWYGRFHDRLTAVQQLAQQQPTLPVATIHEWGQLTEDYQTPDQIIPATTPYLVLDYIQGGSLAQMISTYRQLSLAQAAEIITRIATALDKIHAAGLVHGNLKPSNILITADGDLLLTDFHLMPGGGYLMNVGEQLTLEQAAYVSPEQVQAERALNPRSDIYNLGLIFFEMVTGQRPFQGQSTSRLLRQHAFDSAPSPRRHNSSLPQEIEPILARALAKNDLARYASAGEMAAAVRQLLPAESAPPDEPAEQPFMPVVTPVSSMAPDPLTAVTFTEREDQPAPGPPRSRPSSKPARPPAKSAPTARLSLVRLLFIIALLFALANCCFILLSQAARDSFSPAAGEAAVTNQESTALTSGERSLADLLSSSIEDDLVGIAGPGPRPLIELARFGEGTIREVTVDPVAGLIAIGGPLGVKLYDSQSLEPQATLFEMGTSVVAWLEEGRLLARTASLNNRSGVEITNLAGEIQAQLATGLSSGINQLAVSPDSRQLAILFNNGVIQTWLVADSRINWERPGGDVRAQAIAWSPDSERLAVATNDRLVQIVAGQTGEAVQSLTGSQFNLVMTSWSPDGAFITGLTSGGRIMVWSAASSRLLVNQPGVSSLDWTPDGRYLTVGGNDGRLFFWEASDLARGRFNDVHNWTLHETAVVGLRWLAEPLRLLSWSEDGWLRLHDGDDGSLIAERPDFNTAPFNAISDLAWSPDGQTLAAGSWDRTIRLWAVAEAATSQTLRGHRTYIGPVDWSPDGRWLASGSLDSGGALRLWSVESGTSQPLTYSDDRPVESLAFSPDGRWLAVGLRTGLLVIQPIPPDDSQATISRRFHEAEITGLAWSPDSQRLLSAGADGAVALWQIPEGVLTREWWVESSSSDGLQAAWSPTQPLMALANSMKEIQLWQPDSGELVERLDGPSLVRVHQLSFSPDGRWLAAVGGRAQIIIFSLASGEIAYEGSGHGSMVRTAVWSPVRPNQLATGSDDGTIRLWLLPEGEPGR